MFRGLSALILAFMLVFPGFASAATPSTGGAALSAPGELASFLDSFISRQLADNDIPGAVVVVVKDGAILYQQGYGYANKAQQMEFDPERTLVNIGSVTKLFAATAAMQQVEQGNLDLYTDVNQYLTAFKVPETFTQPITLTHLLTHTAGFDDRVIGWVAEGPDAIEPLAENLATHLPPRIRPPGQISQYSNHGITLAGHLVELASGLSFSDYVATYIWGPLGMTRTAYVPGPDLEPDMATGYGYPVGDGAGQRVYFNVQPAGGIWTTATDMAAFMLAHLQGGEHNGQRILSAETVATMHRQQFTAHPAVSGNAYGFFEHQAGDRRGLHHGGEDPEGFTSQLYLVPEAGTGMFVSYNTVGGQMVIEELTEAFLDRYFPVPAFNAEPSVDAGVSVDSLAGSYRWVRQDRHTLARPILSIMTYRLYLRADADGALVSTTGLVSFLPQTRWIQVEPLVFQQEGGTAMLAFDQDDSGKVTHLHLGWPQPLTMERVAWYDSPALHVGLLLFLVVMFLSAAVGWPIARLIRRLRRREVEMSPLLRRTRLVGGWVSGLSILFLLAMPIVIVGTFLTTYSVSPALKALLVLPIIVGLLTLPLVYLVVRLWRLQEGSLAGRVQHTLVALSAVLFVPFLYYWRLFGFHF